VGAERKRLRCAIYTRVSSEERLEQAFNSLAAQREACVAFVHSQRHEGWRVRQRLWRWYKSAAGSVSQPGRP